MSLSRREFNIETCEATEIQQFACRDSAGNVLVLDVGQPLPEGYEEFTPDGLPTYQEELAVLTDAYQASVKSMNDAYALADLADGVTQTTKQTALRSQYTERKDQYVADKAALKIKHGI